MSRMTIYVDVPAEHLLLLSEELLNALLCTFSTSVLEVLFGD